MCSTKVQKFIEINIDLIDKQNWGQFFHAMKLSFLDNEEAEELIDFFKENNIEFDESYRREVFERFIKNKLDYLRDKEFQINLIDFYYHSGGANWVGYTLTDMEEYLRKNAILLHIKYKTWSQASIDSQIIFNY